MKQLLLVTSMFFLSVVVLACPVCERNQPAVMKGLTHGTGPEDRWDYVVVWVMMIVVLITLFFSIKWLVKPGEKSTTHIKRFVLNNP